jgi:peptide deformylase
VAILDIIEAPHPILSSQAQDVGEGEFGEDLANHCADMLETMYEAPGVGLAAPQVGDSRRIVVIDSEASETPGPRMYMLVNPTITKRSEETICWRETCLSVPDLEVDVERNRVIQLEWRTPLGEAKKEEFLDYEAVIIQHELDHLLGTVLLDRVSRFKRSRWMQKRRKHKRAL